MKTQIRFILFFVIIWIAANSKIYGQQSNSDHLVFYSQAEQESQVSPTEILQSVFTANNGQILFEEIDENHEPELGISHKTFKAAYAGIPVALSKHVVHAKNGKIYALSGTKIPFESLPTTPIISSEQGLEVVLDHINAERYVWEEAYAKDMVINPEKPEGELMILPPIANLSTTTHLVYKYSIMATKPLFVGDMYVDAISGELVFEHSQLCHANVPATGNATYDGAVNFTAETYNNQYKLSNTLSTTNGIETWSFSLSGQNIVLGPITSSTTQFSQDNAVQAHWAGEQTLAYFNQTHNWTSYDNNGSKLNLVVDAYGSQYTNNAFWFQNRAWFGQGDGSNYTSFAATDVVGHEITHGVVQNTANLVYQYESGALNESFADIFGEEIEHFATGQRDWLLGDDLTPGSNNPFRSFIDPNQLGMPDTYYGQYYATGSFDNGGVHTNSSVQNYWFYILSQGATGTNDFGKNYNVSAIGTSKAAKIAFRNLSVYLTPGSTFYDARAGAIQSAIDLYGQGSPEEMAVTNAWYAVGVGQEYGNNSVVTCANGPVELILSFDDKPQNIAWNVKQMTTGNFIAFSGINTYSQNQANTTITTNLPINVAGNYKFTILDIERDGLCCTGGNGYYLLKSGTDTLAEGDIFDLSDAVEFCYNNQVGPSPDLERPTMPILNSPSVVLPTSVDLGWSASSDNIQLYHYTVFVNDSFFHVNTTSHSIGGLTPNTTYEFEVFAFDVNVNYSERSNLITVTTPASADNTPPSAPSNLSASNISSNSFDVSWTAATDNVGVDHYEIFLNNNFYQSTANLNYSISNLAQSTTYTVIVEAVDAAGNRTTSTALNVTTLSSGCAGQNLTLNIQFDDHPEHVGWELHDENSNIVAYSSYGNYAGQTPGSSISTSINGLTNGDYLFIIFDAGGDGLCCSGNFNGSYNLTDGSQIVISGDIYAYSELKTFCVGNTNNTVFDLQPPTSSILTASNPTQTSVDLSWTQSTDNDALLGYAFFLDGSYIGDVPYNMTAVTLPGLAPATTYNIHIVSRDLTGNFSSNSNTETFTTLANGPFSHIVHEGYFESGWDGWLDGGNDCLRYSGARSFEGNYSIRLRDNSGDASSMTLPNLDLSAYDSVRIDFQYYVKGVENGEDFWIQHRAQNGNWTTVETFVKPTDFTNNSFFSGSVLLDAAMIGLNANDELRIRMDASQNNDRIWVDAVVVTGYNNTPSSNLHGNNLPGLNIFETQGKVHTQTPDDVTPISFEVYPNPATEFLTITNLSNTDVRWIIVDFNGVRINQGSDTKSIDISMLHSGIYFIILEDSNGKTQGSKFIKL